MAKKRSSTSLFPHPRLVEDWFAAVLRSTRGPVVESRLCQIIHEAFPRQFVKSLEYAPVDSALFQEELFGSDQHTLERHADLAQRPQMPEFIPIEFKSFLPHTSVPWEYRWGCSLRRDSVDHGIIIFASTADPQRVALVPASTLAPRLKKKKGPPNARHMIDLGTAKLPHQRAAPPFPYGIQPYVMPVSELPGALRHLLACAGGAGGIWHNPSTQSHFRGSIPQTSSDRSLLRRGGASEDTICELHEWFRDSGGGHQVRLNALAPLLGDFHLVGEGEDRRHFVELKAGGLKVDCDSVSQCTARKRKGRMVPFFNWRGQADWLLSTPQTSSMPYALMMPMRDLPREWRDASYGGIDSASTPIRGVRPYLLPWPQGGRQGPPAFCSDIEGCLQQAAGTIQGKDADHLRHLSRSAVEDIIEGEETEPEDDEQQGKAAAKNPNREYQRWYESKAARALNMILVKSCRAVLVDAGPDCTIARYFVCARRLLPTAIDDAASFSDISRLSPHTMLAPLRFIRIKSGSAEHYKSAVHYDLKGHVPCPLVFDSWDPNDLMAPHTRRVADSVNFGDAISLHGGVVPDFPLTWEECEMVEIEGDERNIVTRLLGCFQTGDARTSSIMPASMVFQAMLD